MGVSSASVGLEEVGYEEIWFYITSRQNMAAQYIVTQHIMDLCEWLVWSPGAWVYRRWWEKEGIDLEEERDIAAKALEGEEEKYGEEAGQEETTRRIWSQGVLQ